MRGPLTRRRRRRRSSPRGRPGPAAAPGPTPPGRWRPAASGTTPEQRTRLAGGRAPAVQGGDAVVDVGAARGDEADEGQAARAGVLGGRGEGVAVGLGDGARRSLGSISTRTTSRPSIVGAPRPRRPRHAGAQATGTASAHRARAEASRCDRRRPAVTARPAAGSVGARAAVDRRAGPAASRGHDLADRLAQGPGRGRQQAPAAPGQADRAAGEAVDGDPLPVAAEPVRGGAGRHDGGAEALEGQRGEQAHAVDLGLGHAASMPDRRGLRRRAGRGTPVPCGSSSRRWLGEVGRGVTRCLGRPAGGRAGR